MKIYTVRFRCKARLVDEESTTESDYELQLEAENLEDVYTRLDDYLENWEEGASIPSVSYTHLTLPTIYSV